MQISIPKLQKSTIIALAIAVILFLLSVFGRSVLAADEIAMCDPACKPGAALQKLRSQSQWQPIGPVV